MNSENSPFKEMSLIDHITELRKRLLWSFFLHNYCFYSLFLLCN